MFNNKRIIIYFIFSSTLFFGLLLGENSSGGAEMDFINLFQYIHKFSLSFSHGIDYYTIKSGSIVHSPLFYILIGNLLRCLLLTVPVLLIIWLYL